MHHHSIRRGSQGVAPLFHMGLRPMAMSYVYVVTVYVNFVLVTNEQSHVPDPLIHLLITH